MRDYLLQRNLCVPRERERQRFIELGGGETQECGVNRRHYDRALAADETSERGGAHLENFRVGSRAHSRQRIECGEQQNRRRGIAVERAIEELQSLQEGRGSALVLHQHQGRPAQLCRSKRGDECFVRSRISRHYFGRRTYMKRLE